MPGIESSVERNERPGMRAGASRLVYDSRSNETSPTLTVAIPTYRRFDLLSEALRSVFEQDFKVPVEVIVVDNDASDDAVALKEIAKFANESFAYYKNAENVGMFGNWNRCLELARGRYITILHDDDMLLPEFARQVNRYLRQVDAGPDIIGFRVAILDERGGVVDATLRNSEVVQPGLLGAMRSSVRRESARATLADFFFGNPFCGTLGVVMRRDLALSLGGFDPLWQPIADYEFWCRWLAEVGDIRLVRACVGFYRMRHNESLNPATRSAFVDRSWALRRRLIASGHVARGFSLLLGPLSRVQRLMISHDWRGSSERPVPTLEKATVVAWRLFARVVAWLVPARPRCRSGVSS